jgi:hypothetical protein
MIQLQNYTPEVYYKHSRDFQFIGRLYDIVLNYIKTNADNLYNLPIGQNMNEQLLNLLALTLGFKPKNNYNSKQLLAICSVLPEIMRHKGSLQAMITAVNALLAAEEIEQALDYSIESKKNITLYISQQLSDLTLLIDLFDYILPAGMNYQLVKENQLITNIETNVYLTDSLSIWEESAYKSVDDQINTTIGIANRGLTRSIVNKMPMSTDDQKIVQLYPETKQPEEENNNE